MNTNLNYGIIGNCKSAALINEDTSIDWLCLPQFDSPSVFAKILDDQKGPKAILYVEDLNNDRKILISRDNKYINDMEKNEWVGKKIDFNGRYLV